MARVLQFHRCRSIEPAIYALDLCARWERLSPSRPWTRPPAHPERLGNLLQRLVLIRPAVVFVIEKLVVDIVSQLEWDGATKGGA